MFYRKYECYGIMYVGIWYLVAVFYDSCLSHYQSGAVHGLKFQRRVFLNNYVEIFSFDRIGIFSGDWSDYFLPVFLNAFSRMLLEAIPFVSYLLCGLIWKKRYNLFGLIFSSFCSWYNFVRFFNKWVCWVDAKILNQSLIYLKCLIF